MRLHLRNVHGRADDAPSEVEPFDLFGEIRAVSAEALRLARDGGTVDERTAHLEHKARVMAAIEAAAQPDELASAGLSTRAIAPVVGVHHDTVARDVRRVVDTTPEPVEPVHVNTETGEVSDDYQPERCQDWPLCGHDERDGCDEHEAIRRAAERSKAALRDRGHL